MSLDPAQVILQLLPLPSGTVLAVASADAGPLAPRGTLHLLSASGEPVPGFPEAAQISEMLFDVALNTEGEVLVAGAMTSAWGLPADGLIRLVPTATLTLDHVQWSAEGRIRMDISGSRTEVILEQSPDLMRWQRIREVPMPAEGRITVEEAAPDSRMWFRVRLP